MEASNPNTGANRQGKSWNKLHWTPEEDNLLTRLVRTHGPGNWDHIARHLQRRTGKSCRLRWINQLNPRVDKTPFSEEEQQRILELQRQFGNKWATIASFLPGRTDNQVKNQYHVLVGTRYLRSLGPFYNAIPPGSSERRSVDLSRSESISMVPVGSQFSNVPYGGFGYILLAPGFIALPGNVNIVANNMCPQQRTSHGDPVISDAANFAAFPEPCPVTQPPQGEGTSNSQFIDFLGVGSSN